MAKGEKQFIVIGLGRFGSSVAKKLAELGADVMAVDRDERSVNEASEYATYSVQADMTDPAAVKAVGLQDFDVAVVTIGTDIQSSVLITMICKEAGIRQVIAKAQNDLHARLLKKVGADRVVLPEYEMGEKLAAMLLSPDILDYIKLSDDFDLVEMPVLPEWSGKSIREADIRRRYGLNIIAINRGGKIDISIDPDDVLRREDLIFVIGPKKSIRKIK